jgi:hypothetical protein
MFTDRRAGEPILIADDSRRDTDSCVVIHGTEAESPPRETAFGFYYTPRAYAFPPLAPSISVNPPVLAEPYALELWAEKSTMNDILEPLAPRHNVTLVTGVVGELSATHRLWHVQRVLAHRKPTRILYVSEHDPAGDRMPVSVARKIEYLLRRDGLQDLDIRLNPLVLTRKQGEHYRLPRIPIKDFDKGKRNFEERRGEGAVELDVLEALHCGELGRIVEATIAGYREPTRRAERENVAIAAAARDAVREVRAAVLAEFESEITALRAAFDAMLAEIEVNPQALAVIAEQSAERSRAHVDAIAARAAAFRKLASDLYARMEAEIQDRVPAADEFDWAIPRDANESGDPLFDSTRDYLGQIDRFKHQLGQPTTWRGRQAKPERRSL